MDTITEKFIDEAIKLEINMYKIYTLFQELFPEDSDFWKKLASEEINHAETIRKIKPFICLDKEMSNKFDSEYMESIQNENEKMQKIIDEFEKDSTRSNAFKIALELENNAIEIHYQTYLVNAKKDSYVANVFKGLTGDDKNHAQRVQNYITKSNINI